MDFCSNDKELIRVNRKRRRHNARYSRCAHSRAMLCATLKPKGTPEFHGNSVLLTLPSHSHSCEARPQLRGSKHSRHPRGQSPSWMRSLSWPSWMALRHSRGTGHSKHSQARRRRLHRTHPRSSNHGAVLRHRPESMEPLCVPSPLDQAIRADGGQAIPFCHFCEAEQWMAVRSEHDLGGLPASILYSYWVTIIPL